MTCDLALVVGAARSGTTLTRLLLDAHREIGCPPEAGIPALMAHQAQVWAMINADEISAAAPGDPGGDGKDEKPPTRWGDPVEPGDPDEHEAPGAAGRLSPGAREWIRECVHVPMNAYCESHGKRVYCDKSLNSHLYLGLVHELFPTARMVLVFRHVMDTVASGIEASPWGFNAFGYAPYVQQMPGNVVAALASYWTDHVGHALAWEKEHAEICHRVRYEDLVQRPEETITAVQKFLGVEEDVSVLEAAFDRPVPRGAGDYKVGHTTSVHAASMGRGKRIPISMLPPALLKDLNEKLQTLGYAPLDRSWNAAERQVDGGAQGPWASRLDEMMQTLDIAPSDATGAFAVVAEDHRALRWIIDTPTGRVLRGDGEVDAVLTGTAEDLVATLTQAENLGVLLRSGRLRYIVADDAGRDDLMDEIDRAVTLLHQGLDDQRVNALAHQH